MSRGTRLLCRLLGVHAGSIDLVSKRMENDGKAGLVLCGFYVLDPIQFTRRILPYTYYIE